MVLWFSFGYKPGIFASHANDKLSFDRYAEALNPTFFTTFWNTLWVGLAGTILCLLIAFPVAYWMSVKVPVRFRGLLLALVMVPYWTNFLVRTIGWQIILAPHGWLATALSSVGIIHGPLDILYTRSAVLLGVVYNYLPLMILPLFVAFDRVSNEMREASKDLGAGRIATLFRVTIPLAMPGIIVGTILVYIPLMGDYITAKVLGGAKGNMAGVLVASQFQTAQNWALGSAMAVLLIVVILLSAALAGLIIWLAILPFSRSRKLVIGMAK
ncbi:MAG: ABC transporter permease [Microbacteriaceae bacterium]|nr:ABC transporter permease [Cryobacterium sp.]MBX3103616.1 ABC transporter permease [Cryobacterium sp.]MCC6376930.1 ABC transporter permease [Microbacteriaceae bacterium]